jgi:hypothetical protein
MEVIFFFGLLVVTVFAALGGWISAQKGRDPIEGAVLGGLFGPLGCLIAALMPTQQSRPSRPLVRPSSGGAVKVRRGRPLGEEWMPDFPEDEPRVESTDGMDAQVLGFLRERQEPGLDPLGQRIARGLDREKRKG